MTRQHVLSRAQDWQQGPQAGRQARSLQGKISGSAETVSCT